MDGSRLTKFQKDYLIAELKDLVDNYEVYELESPNDYTSILSILTGILNEDWNTRFYEVEINEFLVLYFKEELSNNT